MIVSKKKKKIERKETRKERKKKTQRLSYLPGYSAFNRLVDGRSSDFILQE
jgi:hypothetical protein